MIKKIIPIVVAVALVASLLAASCTPEREEGTAPSSITIVDSAGRVVEVPQPLERIVALTGPAGEVIRALGAEDDIIGIDKYMAGKHDYYWPNLQDRPSVGSSYNPDYEKIIELEPQVVISYASLGTKEELAEKLESAGIKVVLLDFYKPEALNAEIWTLGEMLGKKERAEAFIDFFQLKLNLVKERVAELESGDKKRVYFEIKTPYNSCNKDSGYHQVIEMAGGANIFADALATYPEIDPETILIEDPDVIIKDAHSSTAAYLATSTSELEGIRGEMLSRAGWAELEAVKNDKVYMTDKITQGMMKPIAVCYLAKWFYPEKFEDMDPESFHREYLEKWQGIPYQGVYVYPPLG